VDKDNHKGEGVKFARLEYDRTGCSAIVIILLGRWYLLALCLSLYHMVVKIPCVYFFLC
jgi:hypothetical protein